MKDKEQILLDMPPGMLLHYAKGLNMTEEKFTSFMFTVMDENWSKISSTTLDYDKDKFIYRELPNGELYTLISYKTHTLMKDGSEQNSENLGLDFNVDERWYFAIVDDERSFKKVLEVYPQFKNADLTIPHQ
ncbi:hypothetical protein [Bartonella sp. HY406]|uniref:hypothetical protein n=1 Tax=Bartonella sp. HY406 TaxID=2979331 RepID=UPI0021CADD69|nr:hypothetical protein [Bartonella sp. HY406]UXN04323.1 hypothetical protein N6B01_04665 [Bartonella sp. HY406]